MHLFFVHVFLTKAFVKSYFYTEAGAPFVSSSTRQSDSFTGEELLDFLNRRRLPFLGFSQMSPLVFQELRCPLHTFIHSLANAYSNITLADKISSVYHSESRDLPSLETQCFQRRIWTPTKQLGKRKKRKGHKKLTQLAKLPHVRFHTNPVVCVLLQEGQPNLDRLGVSVADLDQPAEGDPLKVLLGLLEDEVTLGHSPPLLQLR